MDVGSWWLVCQWNINIIARVVGMLRNDWAGMLYTSRGTVTTCLLTLMLHIAWGHIRLKSTQTDSREVGTLHWCQDNSWQCQLFFIGISLPLFQGKASKCSLDGILGIRFQDSQLTNVFQILRDAWILPWYGLHGAVEERLSCYLYVFYRNSSLSTSFQ